MIKGQKVTLRAISKADIPIFVRWLNDPEVTQYLGGSMMPMSTESEERWFERQMAEGEGWPLTIETADGVTIGNISLMHLDKRNHHAELGIVIGEKKYWSQGYGTDAIRTLLHYAFQELNLHRVFLRVYSYNPRAIRCYEKVGFLHEGRLRQASYRHGAYHDELIMGILREEFNE
jgi:RimJ/RimL family protein N-acetyltransferase